MAPPLSALVAARTQRDFPDSVIGELEKIEQDLGGRQQIIGLLLLAPLSADLEYLLGLLGAPQHQRTSLAEVCALANVLPGDLLKLLGPAALLRGKLKAAQKIGDGIAAVVEDVMRRAAPYEDPCYQCRGTGTMTPEPSAEQPNPSPGPCDLCAGTGRLKYQPSLDRQKLAIEMAQLLPKSGGIQLGVQVNQPAGGDQGSRRGRLQLLTDRLLYGTGGRIDAEVLDTPDTPDPSDAGTLDASGSAADAAALDPDAA